MKTITGNWEPSKEEIKKIMNNVVITDEMRMNWLEQRYFNCQLKFSEHTRILKFGTMGGEGMSEGISVRDAIDKVIRESMRDADYLDLRQLERDNLQELANKIVSELTDEQLLCNRAMELGTYDFDQAAYLKKMRS